MSQTATNLKDGTAPADEARVHESNPASPARGQRGQTMVEYTLILGMITLGIVMVISSLSSDMNGMYDSVRTAL